MWNRTSIIALTIFLLTKWSSVSAATVFNNLGSGPSWDTISGMALLAGGGNDIDAAVHFTPAGGDFRLQQVRAPIEYVGGPNVLDVLLLNDGGALGSGTKPGSVLESIRLTGQMTTPETLLTVNSSLRPIVTAGTRYWVGASVPLPWLFSRNALASGFRGKSWASAQRLMREIDNAASPRALVPAVAHRCGRNQGLYHFSRSTSTCHRHWQTSLASATQPHCYASLAIATQPLAPGFAGG